MRAGCPAMAGARSLEEIGHIASRSCGADAMSMTFPFRGPIPSWLNPDTDGRPYWKPPEIPMPIVGRDLLEGASATYVFAPESQQSDLVAATKELCLLDVPLDPNHKQTVQWIEHIHRDAQDTNPKQTPEYKSWVKWKTALNVIDAWGVFNALQDGRLSGFGDSGQPGSPPHWIHPSAWLELEPESRTPAKFSGGGLVFWNVRLVRTHEVITRSEAQEFRIQVDQEIGEKPVSRSPDAIQEAKHQTNQELQRKQAPPSLATLTAWYQSRKDAWVPGTPIPSFRSDLGDAKAKFGQEDRTRLHKLRHGLAPDEWNVGTPGRKKNAQ